MHKKENWRWYAIIFYITISFYQAFVSKQNVTLFKCFRASNGKTFTLGRARNVPIPHMINIFTIGTHTITTIACKLGIFLATQNLTFEILLFDYIHVNATLKSDHKSKWLVKNIAEIMASFFLVYYILPNATLKWDYKLERLVKYYSKDNGIIVPCLHPCKCQFQMKS